jgi:hypothetical protein
MRRGRKLLIEVLDEALRLLPPTIPTFNKLKIYEPLPDLRRRKRVDANGLKARRSTPNRNGAQWLDIPPFALTKEND